MCSKRAQSSHDQFLLWLLSPNMPEEKINKEINKRKRKERRGDGAEMRGELGGTVERREALVGLVRLADRRVSQVVRTAARVRLNRRGAPKTPALRCPPELFPGSFFFGKTW